MTVRRKKLNNIRTKVLSSASEKINGAREKDYGSPKKNFDTMAAYWSTYLGVPVTAANVAHMMVLLKVSRAAIGAGCTMDSHVDMAGYAALAEELSKLTEPTEPS